jgi:outer membrane biosynthesis protein TonB
VGRPLASVLAACLVALAALGMAACGSSDKADLLPGSTASEISSNLEQVRELAAEGDCVGAEAAAEAVSTQIEQLGGVDKTLKQALREGATRLNEVVVDCEEVTTEEEIVPAVEPAEELEEAEKAEKQKKPAKAEKPEKEAIEPTEETSATPPPQAEGKAKGHEKKPEEEVPPPATEDGSASGGVGPGEAAGGE